MKKKRYSLRRVDIQVSIFTAAIIILSCSLIFFLAYTITYQDMLHTLTERVTAIHHYVDQKFDKNSFNSVNSIEDKDTYVYKEMKELLETVKNATGVMYLYTAKQTEAGEFVYVIDGLSNSAPDFRNPGDAIEQEIIPDLQRALTGESVLPNDIKKTAWGKIFIAYLPIHSGDEVIGVLGIEFEAEHQYSSYQTLRIVIPVIILAACILLVILAVILFRRISNPSFQDLSTTDQLTQLKNRNAFNLDMKNWNIFNRPRDAGIISIDLNNLKQVNDTLGHDAGDQYLQHMANSLLAAQKENVILYRTGGDEFVVVQYDATEDSLRAFLSETEEKFNQKEVEWPIDLSFSYGWAFYKAAEEKSIYDAYRKADYVMIQNKRKYHETAADS